MPYSIGSGGVAGALAARAGTGVGSKPTLIKSKSVSYNATTSDQIFAVSADPGASSKEAMPSAIEIENTGGVSIFLMVGYRSYSDDTSDVATDYLHVLLPPGQAFMPPVQAVISDNADNTIMFGTAVDNLAPDSNEYTDSTANVDDGSGLDIIGQAAETKVFLEPYTSAENCTANLFRVGDLIRVNNEIMEVAAIGDKSDLANNYLTVIRGSHGSTAASDHADTAAVRYPFFNAYHDFDKYTVAQTDSNGKFKCFNFFGQGRSATESQGIIPGSFSVKFYKAGYRSLGLSGITSSSTTSLEAGGSYWFKIAIDGGTAESINFEVDSSNTNWGGTNGVLSKINDALTDKYNNTASNTFQQKSSVSIVNGDVRFTSGQRLSTSAIALTAGTDGASASYNIFAQQNGWFPALANVPDAIAARLPDDVTYDRVTYAQIPNSGVFGYDDGNSRIFGACNGTINYETGAIDMMGCPPNAEFVVSALTNSAFSGKLNEAEPDRINSIVEVLANTPSQKWNGSVEVRTFNAKI